MIVVFVAQRLMKEENCVFGWNMYLHHFFKLEWIVICFEVNIHQQIKPFLCLKLLDLVHMKSHIFFNKKKVVTPILKSKCCYRNSRNSKVLSWLNLQKFLSSPWTKSKETKSCQALPCSIGKSLPYSFRWLAKKLQGTVPRIHYDNIYSIFHDFIAYEKVPIFFSSGVW